MNRTSNIDTNCLDTNLPLKEKKITPVSASSKAIAASKSPILHWTGAPWRFALFRKTFCLPHESCWFTANDRIRWFLCARVFFCGLSLHVCLRSHFSFRSYSNEPNLKYCSTYNVTWKDSSSPKREKTALEQHPRKQLQSKSPILRWTVAPFVFPLFVKHLLSHMTCLGLHQTIENVLFLFCGNCKVTFLVVSFRSYLNELNFKY